MRVQISATHAPIERQRTGKQVGIHSLASISLSGRSLENGQWHGRSGHGRKRIEGILVAKLSRGLIEALATGRESLRTISHYTSIEGFRSIVENNQLWVSNVRFLNDKAEMEYGIREAVKFLEMQETKAENGRDKKKLFAAAKRRILDKGIPSAYACCFCEKNDSLGQWRGYTGGGQGIAIEFNAQDLLKHFRAANAMLAQVTYGQDATRKVLREELDKFINGNVSHDLFADILGDDSPERLEALILTLAPRFKHHSFEDEREWRLIVNDPPARSKIEYRAKDNVLVPFLKLGDKKHPLPITRVIVGPGKDMDITAKSIELFLQYQFKYEDVDVVKSSVPFRI
ncbi:DUF2971 domain-containing protein [Sinorhizobium medicae]|nr:DUF2971 domain-containing protein [Sinorhizobium medicae]